MIFRLLVWDLQREPSSPRRFPLGLRSKRIGSGLESDLVFLDPKIPKNFAEIRLKGLRPIFHSGDSSLEDRDLLIQSVSFFNYRIRAERNFDLFYFLSFLLGLLLFFVPTFPQRNSPNVERKIHSLPARAAFGRVSSLAPPLEEVEFTFPWLKGEAMLHFSSGNIEKGQELEIHVNGKLIGYAESSPGGWSGPQEMRIQEEDLEAGRNQLLFRGKDFAKQERFWGVREVFVEPLAKISQVKEEDPRRPERADDLLALARALYEKRISKTGYLSRAKEALQKAIEVWNVQGGSVPGEALDLKKKIEAAEDQLLKKADSQSLSALRLGRRGEALGIYRRLLVEFPRHHDPKRRQVEEKLREISK